MFVIRYKNIFFALTALLLGISIGAIAFFGLTLGLEFTGGALMEVQYPDGRPAKSLVEESVIMADIGSFSLRESGEDTLILRSRDLSEDERKLALGALSLGGDVMVVPERFTSIGPVIGVELRNKALVALATVIIAMVLFIAYVFRKVSKPVSSWKYGLIAIAALMHDIIVPTGVFAALGYFFGSEVDVLFVVALLTILGYSLNDTIVVFDRVRENLGDNEENNKKEDFELTVGKSLNQTYGRSINTSLTTAIVLLALFLIGGETTRDFALVLIAGVLAGSYSSIFFASPLLVTWEQFSRKKKA